MEERYTEWYEITGKTYLEIQHIYTYYLCRMYEDDLGWVAIKRYGDKVYLVF
jgi:hypothetical protein